MATVLAVGALLYVCGPIRVETKPGRPFVFDPEAAFELELCQGSALDCFDTLDLAADGMRTRIRNVGNRTAAS